MRLVFTFVRVVFQRQRESVLIFRSMSSKALRTEASVKSATAWKTSTAGLMCTWEIYVTDKSLSSSFPYIISTAITLLQWGKKTKKKSLIGFMKISGDSHNSLYTTLEGNLHQHFLGHQLPNFKKENIDDRFTSFVRRYPSVLLPDLQVQYMKTGFYFQMINVYNVQSVKDIKETEMCFWTLELNILYLLYYTKIPKLTRNLVSSLEKTNQLSQKSIDNNNNRTWVQCFLSHQNVYHRK